MTRLYVDHALHAGSTLELPADTAHHVRSVLRLAADADVVLFDGRGNEHAARLLEVRRDAVVALVGQALQRAAESPLAVTLVQSVSRGERMDYTIQKAVELGVSRIVPVITTRTVVRLDDKRADKRLAHWRGIVRHAAEQSGRTRLPALEPLSPLAAWLAAGVATPAWVLHPAGGEALARQPAPHGAVTLVAGPEGGFDPREIAALRAAGVIAVALGPRILRTETAAVAALAVMQALWGDLG